MIESKSILNSNTSQHRPDGNFSTNAVNYSIRVDPKLIRSSIDNGFTSELAFYYFLKFHFKYSRISSKYSPKVRISRLSGLSIPTINKYFDVLGYRDLVNPDRNGWSLKPNQKSRIRSVIKVDKDVTVSEIKHLMLSMILQVSGAHQAFYFSLSEYIQNRKQVKKLSAIKALNGSFAPYFSVRYIAKLLNISQTTAINLIHDLNYRGVIRTQFPRPEFMCRCNPEDVKHLTDSFDYKYVKDGKLYRVQPSRHEFLINPVQCYPMSMIRYKRATKDPTVRKYVDRVNLTLTNWFAMSNKINSTTFLQGFQRGGACGSARSGGGFQDLLISTYGYIYLGNVDQYSGDVSLKTGDVKSVLRSARKILS